MHEAFSAPRCILSKDRWAAEVVDQAGWVHAGEVGYLDEARQLLIVGWKKDLIIRGRRRPVPGRDRGILLELDYIEASAVVGAPDVNLGELVVGYVVPEDGATATRERIADDLRHCVARHKIPDDVVWASELPQATSGKLQRELLREGTIAGLTQTTEAS